MFKRAYVECLHAVAAVPPIGNLMDLTARTGAYGWRRWAASLLAIYNAEKMVALGLPWWNVAATREVEQYLASRLNVRVFEYGAGASTAWLARRATEVVSVEHDPVFIAAFQPTLASFHNVTLMERPITEANSGYVDAIEEVGGLFDLIVVDGRKRAACLAAAMDHLKSDGIVLFDDSGRRRYRNAIEQSGLIEHRYYGRSFCVPYPDHTSLLYRHA